MKEEKTIPIEPIITFNDRSIHHTTTTTTTNSYRTFLFNNTQQQIIPHHHRCWACTLTLTTPFFLRFPTDYTAPDTFQGKGIFCSFRCLLRYYEDEKHKNNPDHRHSLSYIKLMYFKMYNKTMNVAPSPDKSLLEIYGGHMTEDQFRNFTSNIEVYKTLNSIKYEVVSEMFEQYDFF